jgi:hypothetical protein
MKTLLITLIFITSFSLKAEVVEGTINDVICAEINPFVIGDACILFSTDKNTGNKVGLVYSDYTWAYEYASESNDWSVFTGRTFSASSCDTFTSYDEIRELKEYNAEYFYYRCNIFGFKFN